MKNLVGTIVIAVAWAVGSPGRLTAAEPATGWKAGVARVDTTPTAPVRMSGYASRTGLSKGVAHPLFAKALAYLCETDISWRAVERFEHRILTLAGVAHADRDLPRDRFEKRNLVVKPRAQRARHVHPDQTQHVGAEGYGND